MVILRLSRQLCCLCNSLSPLIQLVIPKSSTSIYSTAHFFIQSASCHSDQDVYAYNVKIAALSRAGKLDAALQLFDEMPKRDVVSWNAMVTAYWQHGYLDHSKQLFESMPVRNVVSWNSMIAGCVENGRMEEALDYFCSMPERNTASWNAMISGFIRCGRIEEAGGLFAEMPRRNVISYTAMIDGYAQIGEMERARVLFDNMPYKNEVSWTVMISAYVENGRFHEAKELFDQMPEKGIFAATAMIIGYCKEGKMDSARILFEEIQCKDLVSYNVMITGYAQNGNGGEALKLFTQMLGRCMKPDHATIVSVLTACSSLSSLKEGQQTHAIILKMGLDSSPVSVCNAVVTMYGKCGSIFDAELAFTHPNNPDVVSWNAIISAFSHHGFYEKTLAYFEEMRLSGFEPDGMTFLSLLSACGHSGMVGESLYWFDLMTKNYRILPWSEHYACLVSILSRAGQLVKAYKMIQEMPFEADSCVWGALLAGCRAHSNAELGQLAAAKVAEFDPQNASAYITL